MFSDAPIAPAAALLADPARVAMLWALSDGRRLPAGELARRAGVRPSTASSHLARLEAAGLVQAEILGRHRYFRLANPSVIPVLESLAALLPVPSPGGSRGPDARLRRARTCYDHLAGELGVRLAEALTARGDLVLEGQDYRLTPEGTGRLLAFSLDPAPLLQGRRAFARACLDWSERRFHLAGALGSALLERLLALDWIRRTEASRAVEITALGYRGLRSAFGIELGGASGERDSGP